MQDPAEQMSNFDASVLDVTKVGANHALCDLLCQLATTHAPPEAKLLATCEAAAHDCPHGEHHSILPRREGGPDKQVTPI